ncbi:arylsulfatase [Croceicoccus sp. F390]|uniref:Arylsulfatase n=1 Tax=Croceicoccus esteveae TaxID=3075597 RepID=A0ABU2ZKD3_9SPHN|nr:arylsulfatase [Croceicoccus sp. F390]MDT0575867.1 arylsulfatase [Croceicoccus sp. F390]
MKRPHFLLIVADDLGYSDLGAFGGEISTPHLDALAMSGTRFTDFHSAPACSPTRAMLMTGTDPHLAGIGTMLEMAHAGFEGAPGYEGHLNDRVVTVAQRLRAGDDAKPYHCVMAGKWHLGDTAGSRPAARGFDRSFALLPAGASHFSGQGADRFSVVSTAYEEDGVPVSSLPDDFYSSDYFATRLIEYLDERPRDRPFLAFLPFSAPHWPLQAHDADISRYKGRYDAGPDVLRAQRMEQMKQTGLCPRNAAAHSFVGAPDWSQLDDDERSWSARTMEVYAAMVECMDRNVGRVIDTLRASGDLEDTVVMFLSDNGAEGAMVEALPIVGPIIEARIAEHFDNSLENLGRATSCCWYGPHWAQAATAPSRLHKAFTTQGGIRVPFFACGPGIAGQGAISHAFATAMDVPATMLDMAGVTPSASFEGRSVEPLKGKSMRHHLAAAADRVHPADAEFGWELFGRRAIRRGFWKAVWLRAPEGNAAWQLYDLQSDPGEIHDLASKHPDILASLVEAWERYARDAGVVQTPVSVFETCGAA